MELSNYKVSQFLHYIILKFLFSLLLYNKVKQLEDNYIILKFLFSLLSSTKSPSKSPDYIILKFLFSLLFISI